VGHGALAILPRIVNQPSSILTHYATCVIGPNPVVGEAVGRVDHYSIRVYYVQCKVMIVVMKKAALTPGSLPHEYRINNYPSPGAQE
jgi:hypothetical protein